MRRPPYVPRVLAFMAALALPVLALATAGCSAPKDVSVQVLLVNHTDAPIEVLVKVWDHDGRQVHNASHAVGVLGPSSPGVQAGSFGGPPPTYGARYSWLAHAGNMTQQMPKDPIGVQVWAVHVHEDRIEFEFCPTAECPQSVSGQ